MYSFTLSLFLVYTGRADVAPLLLLLIELTFALRTLYKVGDVVTPGVTVVIAHDFTFFQ